MDNIFEFIQEMCQRYSIDESHGLKHAIGTMKRADDILSQLEDVSEDERKIALYAAALHDTCDHKYTDVEEASRQIREWLLKQGWSIMHADAVIEIITTMSYSKIKKMMGYPDHGPWQRAYHVARHADLLESFIVARCVLYDRQIHPERTEDAHWLRAEELFRDRVFTYVSEGWIFIPEALKEVPRLEAEAIRCLKERCMDWNLS